LRKQQRSEQRKERRREEEWLVKEREKAKNDYVKNMLKYTYFYF